MVLHLQTAAKGAEEHFTWETNMMRDEGIELARDLCDRVGKAYLGHPNYKLIPNHKNFIHKLNTVSNLILRLFNPKLEADNNYYK